MANTADAGTDIPSRGLNEHFAEGYVVALLSAEWKVAGVLAKGLTVMELNEVVSGAPNGDGGTRMLEGTANDDGEIEGTEHELAAFDILINFRKFLLDSDEKWEMHLMLNTRWGWTDFGLAAELSSLISTNLTEQDKYPPRNSFETFHYFIGPGDCSISAELTA